MILTYIHSIYIFSYYYDIDVSLFVIHADFVKPICLPYDDDVTNDYRKTGDALWVAGWGVTGPGCKLVES